MKTRWRRRSGPILRMWPAKRSLRLMMTATRSNRGWVAVSTKSSPVMWERQRLLNPLIFLWTDLTRVHASHACVKLEHTAVLYRRIFMLIGSRWSAHIWWRELNTFCAIIRRCSTSADSSPSHWILLPRYSNEYTFSNCCPSTITWGSLCSSSFLCGVAPSYLLGSLF